MKLANLRGRATIVTETGVVDVHTASRGQLPHDPDRAVLMLSDVSDWYRRSHPRLDRRLTAGSLLADPTPLGPPVVNPSQIFAIGLNYSAHAAETGRTLPAEPLVFTKYASALAGPGDAIVLPTDTCDWEVELVVVMGRAGRAIPVDGALKFVAGYCVGQDVSERHGQMAGERPQFGLAKSHRGFAPIGPWLTTLDELHDPTDLAISAAIDGDEMQCGRTSDMIFDVAFLVSYLSRVCELRPGDLIFTGTPAGVGQSQNPPRYLAAGNVLSSQIEALGTLRNPCISAPEVSAANDADTDVVAWQPS
ncbi:fumarylacetoacetate hydrolase [Nocardia sp. MDA0666]|uniref:fumarylacetoacetate hydrolase family protein n=1 Tax=Nocardia sp. MDA0666 TaxID=2135448 RepID=UPI000D1246FB|nr:fumarylacetoacetate hydrolase family protein [Nocardia sp. MDA0666]PSR70224.1 fumarylacetoacetate hydrolase [Nocardia sp. MDA0666]